MMAALSDICLLITDGKHGDCQNEEGSGFYFVSCKDVKDGWIDYSGVRQITEADFLHTHKRTQLEANDIVITNSGTIGRMALIPSSRETNHTTFQKSVAIVKPNREKVIPRWLYYSLRANRDALVAWAGGTAQKNLLLRDLRAFSIDVPPLPTQRKITAVLSAYDDLIQNNTRRIQILEEMAQAIHRQWFVEFKFPGHEDVPLVDSGTELGQIPQAWGVKRLGDLAESVRRNIKPGELEQKTPYFGLEHLPRKSIALNQWDVVDDVGSTKLAFRRGEILFGKIRPYFHKVGVAPLDGIGSSDIIVIRPKKSDFFGLVLAVVSSERFVEHSTLTSQGTKMPRANWDVLVQYPIAFPNRELLERHNSFMQDTVELIRNYVFKNANLRATRDLLLPRLVSGELDVGQLEIQ